MDFIHYWNSSKLPASLQQQFVLQQLLKKAAVTQFGKKHDFSTILAQAGHESAFRQIVPLHNYEQMYTPWWENAFSGQTDISWPGHIRYFALSSGTSNASSKYIPVTEEMSKMMRTTALRMFSCLPKYDLDYTLYFKDWLMIGGSATLQNHGHCFAGDLSGINARKPPFWLKRLYKPGTKIAQEKDWDQRMKLIAQRAHEWDISIMTGIPSWVQLTLEYVIDYHGLKHIHEIWPNLSVYVSGGIALGPYQSSMEKLLGKEIIYQDTYLASEGFFAYQSRPETNAMQLVIDNGIYYEFVPFIEANFNESGEIKANAQSLTIGEIEEGVDYALVISTCSGAWRYLIGDTIRFTDKKRLELIITGRTKHFLSICGEHLSVDNMNQALQGVKEEMDVTVREFTVAGVASKSHFAHKWYLGIDTHVDKNDLAKALDKELQMINDDYKAERSAMLQELQLEIVPTRVFYDWQRHKGRMNGQSKFPRVMKKEQFKEWEQFVSQQMQTL